MSNPSRFAGFAPDLDAWDAWRPDEIAARLSGIAVPWYIAGGWAIDLFLGQQRRPHDDLEIGIPADRFDEIPAALPQMTISSRIWLRNALALVHPGHHWPENLRFQES